MDEDDRRIAQRLGEARLDVARVQFGLRRHRLTVTFASADCNFLVRLIAGLVGG